MSKTHSLKKEGRRLRRLTHRAFLYGTAGAIVLALVFLAVLFRFSPLDKIYLYLLAGFSALVISYPLAFRSPSREIKGIYQSAETIKNALEKLGEGDFKIENNPPSHLKEVWETLLVSGENLRNRVVAIYDSLQRIRANVEEGQCQKAREELESLQANIEQDFEL